MIYTGIGSRKTPKHIQFLMTMFSLTFNQVLRSGHADGADMAFEIGASQKEIYLPAKNFNGSYSNLIVTEFEKYSEIKEIIKSLHPKWHACSDFAKLLHMRNVCQIIGKDLDSPSDIVICWTPDGANNRTKMVSSNTGGTGTAIRLAQALDITVLNWANIEDFKMAISLLDINLFKKYVADHSELIGDEYVEDVIAMIDEIRETL